MLAVLLSTYCELNIQRAPATCNVVRTAADGQRGKFSVGGEAFPVHVLNLPTSVESYKTYDDIHLVKSNDVGQV